MAMWFNYSDRTTGNGGKNGSTGSVATHLATRVTTPTIINFLFSAKDTDGSRITAESIRVDVINNEPKTNEEAQKNNVLNNKTFL